MAASHPTYVYGVRKPTGKPVSGEAGIGGMAIDEVVHDDLAALVSELPDDGELHFGREELAAHARVLEHVLEDGTVLPMRFGVVMEDRDAVTSRVPKTHHDELVQQLERFDEKVELRVRAIYDEAQVVREVVAEDDAIRVLGERVRTQPDDATYFDRIRLGELIVEAIGCKRSIDAERILHPLEPLAHEVRVAEPTHERMVVSASFLVDRERMSEFDTAVDEVGRAQAGRMRLTYTGPLPPHSFAELTGAASDEPVRG